MNKENNIFQNIPLVLLNIALFLLVFNFASAIYFTYSNKVFLNQNLSKKPMEDKKMKILVLAKSAVVYDVLEDKILFNKNGENILPLASLTKIITALTAIDEKSPETLVKVEKEFLEEEGDSGLLVGEKWRLSDIVDYSLLVSSNDGARSVASVIGSSLLKSSDFASGRKFFIKKMNQKAQEIGAKTLFFNNETGIDNDFYIGGKGNALDFARVMAFIIKNKPTLIEKTSNLQSAISSLDEKHIAKNTNIFVGSIPNILASKTGFTEKAGGNLSVVFDAGVGRPIVVVVLGSTEKGRFEDVLKIASSTYSFIADAERVK